MINQPSRKSFLKSYSSKPIIFITGVVSILYLGIIIFLFSPGNLILFSLLIFGEIFHTWQALTYLYTVWDTSYEGKSDKTFCPKIDVFITVAGEPIDIVRQTLVASLEMDYPNHTVFILNDGYVAGKDNWREVIKLSKEHRVCCFTRKLLGGAKAGNINHALSKTISPYVLIFDADHVPYKHFLKKTVPYLCDPNLGFIQTPQYYKNAMLNITTTAAWEQQELFYGPICQGKNRLNSATMCGTNMIISRKALNQVGGMCADSIAEDFATGMFIHQKGWKSLYIPEVLAEGLAPEDFLSYTKQQFRWARGALDVLFKYNVLMRKGLSITQKIQYLSSASFFLSGLVVLINILLPIIFLYTGMTPVNISTMFLAIIFIPYIFLSIYNLSVTSNFQFTFRALSFAISGFWIHLQALWTVLTRKKSIFAITSKRAIEGNFIMMVVPHFIYIGLFAIGVVVAVSREGLSPSVINNIAWAIFTVGVFIPYIKAAIPNFSFKKNLVNTRVAIIKKFSLFRGLTNTKIKNNNFD